MKRNLIFKWNSINSFVRSFISFYFAWLVDGSESIYLSFHPRYLILQISLFLLPFEPDQRNRLHTHPQISPAHCHHHHRHRHHRHPFWKSENSFARWLFLLIKLCAFVIIFLNCCILFCPRHWLACAYTHTHAHNNALAKWLVHIRSPPPPPLPSPLRCCQQRAVSHSANEICHLIRELN